MKQTLFMIALTAAGSLGVFVEGPIAALSVYYLFAVLRPQYLWQWALPPDIVWSQIVAISALIATFLYAASGGRTPGSQEPDPPFRGFSTGQKLYLAFGVWVILSYFTAQNADVAFIWLVEYLKIFTMFIVGAFVVRRIDQAWRLYLVATAALAYIAYEINALYVFQGRLDVWKNGYGGLDNNGAGLMLAMGVPLAIYAWEGTQKVWRWIFAAAIPVLVHAMLMTYSRGAMVSLILATPLIVIRSRRKAQFSVILVLMAFAVPVMAGPEIRARFLTLNNVEVDESANSRLGSWAAAFRIANDYPVMGVGIRNSNLFSYQYGADMEGRTIHSQYLQILADSGYPALAFYIGGTLAVLFGCIRARRQIKDRTDEEARVMRAMLNGIEGTVVVFAVGSTFLSLEVFELPYLIVLLGGQVAMIAHAQSTTAQGEVATTERMPAPATPPPVVSSWVPVHQRLAQPNPTSGARRTT